MKAKIGNMAKSEKYVVWCQALFPPYITASLPHSLSFHFFFSVSLEACQLDSWMPPRELEGRGCAWSRRGRVTDRGKMR